MKEIGYLELKELEWLIIIIIVNQVHNYKKLSCLGLGVQLRCRNDAANLQPAQKGIHDRTHWRV